MSGAQACGHLQKHEDNKSIHHHAQGVRKTRASLDHEERGEKPSEEAATELGSCPAAQLPAGLRAERGQLSDPVMSVLLGSGLQHETLARPFSGLDLIDVSSSRIPTCCLRAPPEGAAFKSSDR